MCNQRAVGWACQAAPDDRAVLENEIARLRAENAALKKEMLAHGLAVAAARRRRKAPARTTMTVTIRLPRQCRYRPHGGVVGQLWHRFVEAIARAQKQVLNKS